MTSINHTRIRNTIDKMTDLKISSELLPLVEKSLIEDLNELLDSAKVKGIMRATNRKTLFREDLGLDKRYFELGETRTFAKSELRNLILKNIGNEKYIQSGVIEIIRGYLVEELRKKIIKVQKLIEHSPANKIIKAKYWEVYYK